ncbi:MAG: phenylacetate--CoA ligase [Thermodesulfobacteriota bacterium]|nr:phenylacetate--CoA ligase [Thermodesulfobacteriota bacterium]
MPWNREFESMPLEQLQKFQLEKLKETVEWVTDRVPFYKRKFEEAGVIADDLKSIKDVSKLPFTVKNDLRDNYPFGLCAVPMEEVVRVHASSGTTGKPVTAPYTAEDVEQWTECVTRALWAYGVRKEDVVQNSYGHGLFTGGFGLHLGISRMGCANVPLGTGFTERQVALMKDFKATVLCCTPSYALTIAEKAESMNIDIKSLFLKIGVFGAEPWSNEMCNAIEERMGIKAMDIFGLTELSGPGMAYECSAKRGAHINEDHFIAEVVDPATLEPLPLGEKGELVFTAIQRRAMPLIRYRTKDITRLVRDECPCKRTFVRMERISGRTDDMLIISGVNVFPSQVESLLLEIPELEPQYRLVVRKSGYLDKLTVQVEAKKEIYELGREKQYEVEAKAMAHIKGIIGIRVGVDIVEPKSIDRSEGKAIRVLDERP